MLNYKEFKYPDNILIRARALDDIESGLIEELNRSKLYHTLFKIMIMDTLTMKEQYVLTKRYVDGTTLRAIGNDMFLSQERVRQIEAKAFAKIRHPYRHLRLTKVIRICESNSFIEDMVCRYINEDNSIINNIVNSFAEGHRNEAIYLIATSKFIQQFFNMIPSHILSVLKDIDINDIKYIHEYMEKQENNIDKSLKLSDPIAALNLSVRAFNCLTRHGVNTIDDLIDLPKDEFMRIRYIDMRCATEITYALKLNGFKFRYWDGVENGNT